MRRWVPLAALLPLLLWEALGGDLWLARQLADGHGFYAQHAFWAERLLHDGARQLMGGLLGLAAISLLWQPVWAPPRRERAWALVFSVAAMASISLLKARSLTSCPWALAEFGGQALAVSHWAWGLVDGGPGHCFPSGHAAGAFGLLCLVLPWLQAQPRAARWAFAALLLFASAASWAQVARGAHFLSHCLWSAWLCGLWAGAYLAASARRKHKGPRVRPRSLAPAVSASPPQGAVARPGGSDLGPRQAAAEPAAWVAAGRPVRR